MVMMYWSVVLLVGALFVSESEAATLTQIFFVYPGTKWCGNGATAKSYTDLGKLRVIDVCCRAHDHCPNQLESMASGFGIYNFRLHTISECKCDDRFEKCLRAIDSPDSRRVKLLYDTLVGDMCFNLFPEKACVSRTWYGWCSKYGKTYTAKMRKLTEPLITTTTEIVTTPKATTTTTAAYVKDKGVVYRWWHGIY